MKILFRFLSFSIVLLFTSCSNKENAGTSTSGDSLKIEHIFPLQSQHCHGSSIAELPNRDLLTVWFQGSGERTADDVAIMGSRYDHKNQKWEEPFVMADVPGFPDINPVVFIDPLHWQQVKTVPSQPLCATMVRLQSG